jgi:uncharacterized phage-like protein YoqJ
MKNYKLRIKGSDKTKTLKAKSLLEAKVLFCEREGLKYILFAGKLELVRPDRASQDKTIKKVD